MIWPELRHVPRSHIEPVTYEVKAVAIDLDGTMIHSAPDLAAAANLTLEQMGAPILSLETVIGMIGDGIDTLLKRCVKESLGKELSDDEMEKYRLIMREFYAEDLFTKSSIYPGVVSSLTKWLEKGIELACITNKASELTLPLLEKAQLGRYFNHTYCADTPADRKPAPAMIHSFLSDSKVTPDYCVMIGDSVHDLHAAENAGVAGIGVSYGYGEVDPNGNNLHAIVDNFDMIDLHLAST